VREEGAASVDMILPAYTSNNGLTDGWASLMEAAQGVSPGLGLHSDGAASQTLHGRESPP